jgi:membrane protease YdiL (CAAX protease family)
MCALYFCTSVLFAYAAETNFWTERKKALSTQNNPQHPQYAALSSALPTASSFNLPRIAPLAGSLSPVVTATAFKKFGKLPHNLSAIAGAIPLTHANIHEVFAPHKSVSSTPPVVLVQDIHLNPEAQFNIATVLQSLIDHEAIGAIGIEGAFDAVDVQEFRRFEPKHIVKQAMDVFVENKLLSAPSYVGITSIKEPPLLLGLDDRANYDANVNAYLESRRLAEKVKENLAKAERDLQTEKDAVFSSELKKFDAMMKNYREGSMGLGEYVEHVHEHGAWIPPHAVQWGGKEGSPPSLPTVRRGEERESSLVLALFLEAFRLEKTLNFQRVEQERKQVLEKLSPRLSEQETKALLSQSVAYRLGQMSFADYYQQLKTLCEAKGVSLSHTPAFDEYIRYVLLADGINIDMLFKEVGELEKQVLADLITTDEQRQVADASQYLMLANKLVKFELTSKEWGNYKSIVHSRLSIDQGSQINNNSLIQKLLTIDHRLNLLSFERFYEHADTRSEKMVENLKKFQITNDKAQNNIPPYREAMGRLGGAPPNLPTGRRGEESHAAVLVVGGFHTPHITDLLKKQNIPYIVVSPKITKIDNDAGSSYLTVFEREKTPLDKLLAQEKLFINPETVNLRRNGRLWMETMAAILIAGATIAGVAPIIEHGLIQMALDSGTILYAGLAVPAGFSLVSQLPGGGVLCQKMSDRWRRWWGHPKIGTFYQLKMTKALRVSSTGKTLNDNLLTPIAEEFIFTFLPLLTGSLWFFVASRMVFVLLHALTMANGPPTIKFIFKKIFFPLLLSTVVFGSVYWLTDFNFATLDWIPFLLLAQSLFSLASLQHIGVNAIFQPLWNWGVSGKWRADKANLPNSDPSRPMFVRRDKRNMKVSNVDQLQATEQRSRYLPVIELVGVNREIAQAELFFDALMTAHINLLLVASQRRTAKTEADRAKAERSMSKILDDLKLFRHNSLAPALRRGRVDLRRALKDEVDQSISFLERGNSLAAQNQLLGAAHTAEEEIAALYQIKFGRARKHLEARGKFRWAPGKRVYQLIQGKFRLVKFGERKVPIKALGPRPFNLLFDAYQEVDRQMDDELNYNEDLEHVQKELGEVITELDQEKRRRANGQPGLSEPQSEKMAKRLSDLYYIWKRPKYIKPLSHAKLCFRAAQIQVELGDLNAAIITLRLARKMLETRRTFVRHIIDYIEAVRVGQMRSQTRDRNDQLREKLLVMENKHGSYRPFEIRAAGAWLLHKLETSNEPDLAGLAPTIKQAQSIYESAAPQTEASNPAYNAAITAAIDLLNISEGLYDFMVDYRTEFKTRRLDGAIEAEARNQAFISAWSRLVETHALTVGSVHWHFWLLKVATQVYIPFRRPTSEEDKQSADINPMFHAMSLLSSLARLNSASALKNSVALSLMKNYPLIYAAVIGAERKDPSASLASFQRESERFNPSPFEQHVIRLLEERHFKFDSGSINEMIVGFYQLAAAARGLSSVDGLLDLGVGSPGAPLDHLDEKQFPFPVKSPTSKTSDSSSPINSALSYVTNNPIAQWSWAFGEMAAIFSSFYWGTAGLATVVVAGIYLLHFAGWFYVYSRGRSPPAFWKAFVNHTTVFGFYALVLNLSFSPTVAWIYALPFLAHMVGDIVMIGRYGWFASLGGVGGSLDFNFLRIFIFFNLISWNAFQFDDVGAIITDGILSVAAVLPIVPLNREKRKKIQRSKQHMDALSDAATDLLLIELEALPLESLIDSPYGRHKVVKSEVRQLIWEHLKAGRIVGIFSREPYERKLENGQWVGVRPQLLQPLFAELQSISVEESAPLGNLRLYVDGGARELEIREIPVRERSPLTPRFDAFRIPDHQLFFPDPKQFFESLKTKLHELAIPLAEPLGYQFHQYRLKLSHNVSDDQVQRLRDWIRQQPDSRHMSVRKGEKSLSIGVSDFAHAMTWFSLFSLSRRFGKPAQRAVAISHGSFGDFGSLGLATNQRSIIHYDFGNKMNSVPHQNGMGLRTLRSTTRSFSQTSYALLKTLNNAWTIAGEGPYLVEPHRLWPNRQQENLSPETFDRLKGAFSIRPPNVLMAEFGRALADPGQRISDNIILELAQFLTNPKGRVGLFTAYSVSDPLLKHFLDALLDVFKNSSDQVALDRLWVYAEGGAVKIRYSSAEKRFVIASETPLTNADFVEKTLRRWAERSTKSGVDFEPIDDSTYRFWWRVQGLNATDMQNMAEELARTLGNSYAVRIDRADTLVINHLGKDKAADNFVHDLLNSGLSPDDVQNPLIITSHSGSSNKRISSAVTGGLEISLQEHENTVPLADPSHFYHVRPHRYESVDILRSHLLQEGRGLGPQQISPKLESDSAPVSSHRRFYVNDETYNSFMFDDQLSWLFKNPPKVLWLLSGGGGGDAMTVLAFALELRRAYERRQQRAKQKGQVFLMPRIIIADSTTKRGFENPYGGPFPGKRLVVKDGASVHPLRPFSFHRHRTSHIYKAEPEIYARMSLPDENGRPLNNLQPLELEWSAGTASRRIADTGLDYVFIDSTASPDEISRDILLVSKTLIRKQVKSHTDAADKEYIGVIAVDVGGDALAQLIDQVQPHQEHPEQYIRSATQDTASLALLEALNQRGVTKTALMVGGLGRDGELNSTLFRILDKLTHHQGIIGIWDLVKFIRERAKDTSMIEALSMIRFAQDSGIRSESSRVFLEGVQKQAQNTEPSNLERAQALSPIKKIEQLMRPTKDLPPIPLRMGTRDGILPRSSQSFVFFNSTVITSRWGLYIPKIIEGANYVYRSVKERLHTMTWNQTDDLLTKQLGYITETTEPDRVPQAMDLTFHILVSVFRGTNHGVIAGLKWNFPGGILDPKQALSHENALVRLCAVAALGPSHWKQTEPLLWKIIHSTDNPYLIAKTLEAMAIAGQGQKTGLVQWEHILEAAGTSQPTRQWPWRIDPRANGLDGARVQDAAKKAMGALVRPDGVGVGTGSQGDTLRTEETEGVESSPINSALSYVTNNPLAQWSWAFGEMAAIYSSFYWGTAGIATIVVAGIYFLHFAGWYYSNFRGRSPPAFWKAFVSHTAVFGFYALVLNLSLSPTVAWIYALPFLAHMMGDIVMTKTKGARLSQKSNLTPPTSPRFHHLPAKSWLIIGLVLFITMFDATILKDLELNIDGMEGPLLLLSVVVGAGVIEEVLYRYGIYRKALRSYVGIFASVMISSSIFLLVHIAFGDPTIPELFGIFTRSLIITLIYEASGKLSLAMLVHVINNLSLLAFLPPTIGLLPMHLIRVIYICFMFYWVVLKPVSRNGINTFTTFGVASELDHRVTTRFFRPGWEAVQMRLRQLGLRSTTGDNTDTARPSFGLVYFVSAIVLTIYLIGHFNSMLAAEVLPAISLALVVIGAIHALSNLTLRRQPEQRATLKRRMVWLSVPWSAGIFLVLSLFFTVHINQDNQERAERYNAYRKFLNSRESVIRERLASEESATLQKLFNQAAHVAGRSTNDVFGLTYFERKNGDFFPVVLFNDHKALGLDGERWDQIQLIPRMVGIISLDHVSGETDTRILSAIRSRNPKEPNEIINWARRAPGESRTLTYDFPVKDRNDNRPQNEKPFRLVNELRSVLVTMGISLFFFMPSILNAANFGSFHSVWLLVIATVITLVWTVPAAFSGTLSVVRFNQNRGKIRESKIDPDLQDFWNRLATKAGGRINWDKDPEENGWLGSMKNGEIRFATWLLKYPLLFAIVARHELLRLQLQKRGIDGWWQTVLVYLLRPMVLVQANENPDRGSTKGASRAMRLPSESSPINSAISYVTNNRWFQSFWAFGEMAAIFSSFYWGTAGLATVVVAGIYFLHFAGWYYSNSRGRSPPAFWKAFVSHTAVFGSYALMLNLNISPALVFIYAVPFVFHLTVDGKMIHRSKWLYKKDSDGVNGATHQAIIKRAMNDIGDRIKAQADAIMVLDKVADYFGVEINDNDQRRAKAAEILIHLYTDVSETQREQYLKEFSNSWGEITSSNTGTHRYQPIILGLANMIKEKSVLSPVLVEHLATRFPEFQYLRNTHLWFSNPQGVEDVWNVQPLSSEKILLPIQPKSEPALRILDVGSAPKANGSSSLQLLRQVMKHMNKEVKITGVDRFFPPYIYADGKIIKSAYHPQNREAGSPVKIDGIDYVDANIPINDIASDQFSLGTFDVVSMIMTFHWFFKEGEKLEKIVLGKSTISGIKWVDGIGNSISPSYSLSATQHRVVGNVLRSLNPHGGIFFFNLSQRVQHRVKGEKNGDLILVIRRQSQDTFELYNQPLSFNAKADVVNSSQWVMESIDHHMFANPGLKNLYPGQDPAFYLELKQWLNRADLLVFRRQKVNADYWGQLELMIEAINQRKPLHEIFKAFLSAVADEDPTKQALLKGVNQLGAPVYSHAVESAHKLADILAALQLSTTDGRMEAIKLLAEVAPMNVGDADEQMRYPFIEQWDKWSKDQNFINAFTQALADKNVTLNPENNDLLALVLEQMKLTKVVPSKSPRICIFNGRETASVVMAALRQTGLNKRTEIWVSREDESYYQSIIEALKQGQQQTDVKLRVFSDMKQAGLDNQVFDPTLIAAQNLSSGSYQDVLFILSDDIVVNREGLNLMFLKDLFPVEDRRMLENLDRVIRQILTAA